MPSPTVLSCASLSKTTSAPDVVNASWALTGRAAGSCILEFNEDPIVSSDVLATDYSSIFDSLATMVMDGGLVKVIAWFDNGWGYAQRVVDLIRLFAQLDGRPAGEGR